MWGRSKNNVIKMRNQPIPTPLLNGFNYYIKIMKENFPRLLFSLRGDTKGFQHLYLYALIMVLFAILSWI